MKPRHRRFVVVIGALVTLGIAATFVVKAFQKNLVFFYTPTQVRAGEAPRDKSFRIGGMVEAASLKKLGDGLSYEFIVTDTKQRMVVQYQGLLPDLFKEGKGVVAQGRLERSGYFRAEEVLAKHDENYMPPEAAHAIEQAKNAELKGIK